MLRTMSVKQFAIGNWEKVKKTSNRPTGVRYLEKAVFNLDYGQLKLVFHALEERKQGDTYCICLGVLNHAEVVTLLKDEGDGRIIGARILNNLSGK
ncbi:hypothetical protein K7X08_003157 [Anisodus acutangulus]|uniref:glycerol-3-phosphate dehydrogenase n=1 Tax=Anisodus acutangulus TaxID=402998 RepID=A0A9Q1RHN4_9SOLA|nr:hypothetical protein K7X08_003157 [Anisodus acutangulus]